MKHRPATMVTALVLAMLASGAADAGTETSRHPDAPSELAALEFLIGTWDLTTSFAQADGSRREAKAVLRARYALGGFGMLVEETHGSSQEEGGIFVGGVLYTVNPRTRRLVGASNNTLGNRKVLEVTVGDEAITIVQSGELFGGRKGFNRHTLFNLTPNRYELRLDACGEAAESCIEGTYSYVAVRRSAGAADRP